MGNGIGSYVKLDVSQREIRFVPMRNWIFPMQNWICSNVKLDLCEDGDEYRDEEEYEDQDKDEDEDEDKNEDGKLDWFTCEIGFVPM